MAMASGPSGSLEKPINLAALQVELEGLIKRCTQKEKLSEALAKELYSFLYTQRNILAKLDFTKQIEGVSLFANIIHMMIYQPFFHVHTAFFETENLPWMSPYYSRKGNKKGTCLSGFLNQVLYEARNYYSAKTRDHYVERHHRYVRVLPHLATLINLDWSVTPNKDPHTFAVLPAFSMLFIIHKYEHTHGNHCVMEAIETLLKTRPISTLVNSIHQYKETAFDDNKLMPDFLLPVERAHFDFLVKLSEEREKQPTVKEYKVPQDLFVKCDRSYKSGNTNDFVHLVEFLASIGEFENAEKCARVYKKTQPQYLQCHMYIALGYFSKNQLSDLFEKPQHYLPAADGAAASARSQPLLMSMHNLSLGVIPEEPTVKRDSISYAV